MLFGIDVGLLIFLAFGCAGIAFVVIDIRKRLRFDEESRELRIGREAPIPFRDLEVRVFNYHREEDPETKNGGRVGGVWGGMAAGVEEIHTVYVRAGKRRVDLKEFRSAEEAVQRRWPQGV